MKPIKRSQAFEKHFRIRISPHEKLLSLFKIRYLLFEAGERGYPLKDHELTGKLSGKRAFSITADVRVIYAEQDNCIMFLDVGSHNQVY